MSFYANNHSNDFIQNFKKFQDKMISLYWRKNPGWEDGFKEFPDEKFKPIDGFQGFYFISNYGKIVSFKKKTPDLRQPSLIKGFLAVTINHFGRNKILYLHELVYTHFVGKKKPYHRIIHKNANIDDNYYKNLKEVSIASLLEKKDANGSQADSPEASPRVVPESQEKSAKATKHKRIPRTPTVKPEAISGKSMREMDFGVLQFSPEGKFVREYSSLREAGADLEIDPVLILGCLKRESRVAGGYQWRYRADPNFDDGIFDISPVPPSANSTAPVDNRDTENMMNKRNTRIKRNQGATKPILQYDLEGNLLREFPSLTEAGLAAGVTAQAISYSLKEFTRTAGGFKWSLKDRPVENSAIN